ncbi:hypothetical protein Tco_0401377 [Tanacetum coccineum]
MLKKVKSLEKALKRNRKNVDVSCIRGESKKEKSTVLFTLQSLGECSRRRKQSYNLRAAKLFVKSTSQSVSKAKSTDKGKRYRRRARTSISTSSIILSPKKGQREGKAQMVEEDIQATHKTKEEIRQEEARLEEAIRLQAQMDGRSLQNQIHLDKKCYILKKIGTPLGQNWKLIQSSADQKAKSKRSKPMTQVQQREYMSTFIKNQRSWKLSQLKKLSFKELKTEFEKLMKSIESFVPMETEARVKRHGLQLEQETSKKQKIDIEDASITKGKDEVVKEEEAEVPVKKTGMRRKQKARKGINMPRLHKMSLTMKEKHL